MTGSSMATGCDVSKRYVTPKGFPWVRCAHSRAEVAQFPPYWDLFTGSDVIKRHVTREVALYPIKRHP